MAKYIPEKHYVGWGNFAEKDALAFMTVWGTSAAAKKRMKTVDDWVAYRSKNTIGAVKQVLDNVPLTGFEIAKEVRRWTTSNVVWRITDPRGFQLEISSNNMAYILGNCVIDNGVIKDELIWVRDGKDNYLLPTASKEFATYKRNSKAKASNIKISDINVGDRISLLTGETGIYLGMYTCVKLGSSYCGSDKIIDQKRYHIIRDEQNPNDITYVGKSSWQSITIEERGAAENKDYSNEMNANIDKVNISKFRIRYVCQKKLNTVEILATNRTIPYDQLKHSYRYFMNYKGEIYYGMRSSDSWKGTIYPYCIDFANNQVSYQYHNGIQVSCNSTNPTRWSSNKTIDVEEIRNIDKFVFTVQIEGKEYVLDL